MATEQSQEQRSFLRERFLRMIASVSGSPVDMSLQEKTRVSGKFNAVDVDFHHIHVSDLSTPMGVIPHATLRTSDVHVMNFPSVHHNKK